MILFHVQHLLGSGHVQRIRLIAEALARRDLPVAVVSGGFPICGMIMEGVELIQLEPLRSDGIEFSRLIGQHGIDADEGIFARRQQQLNDVVNRLRPQLLVIESWPFGRRNFSKELTDLIKFAAPAKVVCSIRDILQQRKLKRQKETVSQVDRYFDAILVHGDEALAPLDQSFELAHELGHKLQYTGYVAPAPVPRSLDPGGIVVAAGGGAAGGRLYSMALEAALRDTSGRRWTILAGTLAEGLRAELAQPLPGHVVIEANRADFRELLAESELLIAQSGYNTMMDVLVTGIPMVAVPFEGVGETEQLQRAEIFKHLGVCEICREQASGEALLHAVTTRLERPEPFLPVINIDGIENSADILQRMCQFTPQTL